MRVLDKTLTAIRHIRVERRHADRRPDPSGPFTVQIGTDRLTVMTEMAGDR